MRNGDLKRGFGLSGAWPSGAWPVGGLACRGLGLSRAWPGEGCDLASARRAVNNRIRQEETMTDQRAETTTHPRSEPAEEGLSRRGLVQALAAGAAAGVATPAS